MRWIAFSVLVVSQLACVTEVSNTFTKNIDQKKFVETSVQAGVEYIKVGKTDSAFRHLKKALKADSKSSSAHNAMALLYVSTGDKALAEKHFKSALHYDEGFSRAQNNYASYLYQEGRYQDALGHLEKASTDPSYDKRDVAFENIGHCHLKLGQLAEAKTAYKKALRVNSNLPQPYLKLALMAYDQKQYSQSNQYLKAFGKLVRHTPESLWLGIRLERTLGDKNQLASYELALKNLYSDSKEYALLKDSY